MRRLCGWLFGALSVPPMLLLSVSLLSRPAFGQTPLPAPGQVPSYSSVETEGFRAYFVQIMDLESLADQLKAQGKDDTAVRGAIQKDARLTDQETSLLKQVAQQCNAADRAQATASMGVAASLRQQYPPVAGTTPPTAVSQQLAALEAQRAGVISGCMQQLKGGMTHARFGYLDLYVLVHVASKLKHGAVPPGAKGAATPQ